MCDLDYDDNELEPGEVERMIAFYALGSILADMIVHPEGVRHLSEMLDE